MRSQDIVRFDEFAFDMSSLELHHNGVRIDLQRQPAQVLALLLRKPGALVTREELKEAVWKDRIVEFDGGLNYTIRHVRKALGDNANEPSYVETLQGRGYRFIADCEVMPAGLSGRPVAATSGRILRLFGLAAALVAVVAGAFAWLASGSRGALAGDRTMLAVVPFEALSETDSTHMFARGLNEDLTTELAMLAPDRLGVVGPASIRLLGEADPQFAGIGARLGADYAVHGAVRQYEGQRRITVRVENARDGSLVWGRRYDRVVGRDDMAVQAAIARDIAAALSIEVLGAPRSDRLDDLRPAVQESLLVARWLISRPDSEDVQHGLARLATLRDIVPDFAPLWALTARGQADLRNWDLADGAARRAVELDPDFAEGHFQLARASMNAFRLDEALSQYRRATELAPGIAQYHQSLAHFLANVLRFDESISHMEFARALDPISTSLETDLSAIYLAAGRYDDALRHCTTVHEARPSAEWALYCLLAAHYFKGEHGAAVDVAMEIMRGDSASEAELAAVRAANAETRLAVYFQWNLDRIKARQARGEKVFAFAAVHAHAMLQHREATLALLRNLVDAREYAAQWIARDPWLRFLHGDRRFEDMLGELGLPSPT